MLITLTTDFGWKDWFVGTMKGVVLGINPKAALVDLTHEISPGDIRAGAFALMGAYRFFPPKTVHVVVVDPGVGSARAALAVKTENYFFVGPDNGVLSWALAKERILAIHRLENPKYFLPQVSHTFHGRDIFAPCAAYLSKGLSCEKLGPTQNDFDRLTWPEVILERNRIVGEVVYIDRFGNAITNIPNSMVEGRDASVVIRRNTKCRLRNFYQAVPVGVAVTVPGSSGFLEVGINGGNASRKLKLTPGSKITILY